MNIIIAVDNPKKFTYLVNQFKERITIVESPKIVIGLSKKEKIYKYIKIIQNFGIPNEKVYNAIWVKKKLFTKNPNYSSIKKIFVLSCSRIHCNFYLFRKILRFLSYHLTLDKRFTELLKEKNINKVILDGLTSIWANNSYWISASKHLGIDTTTLITNWDHPTTRGYESIDAKEYLVWGKSMRDEIIKYHDIESHKVNIKGSIIFDMYSDSSFLLSNNQIKSIHNTIIPDKYVLFLTHSPYYPYNFELVKYIRKQLQDDMALIVRLHPLYLDDFAKSELEKHKKYGKANSNVIYFYPNSSSNSLAADMSYGEIQLSASLVANALIMINCMSTMLLDGLISNKKVINIAFDWRKRISHPIPLSIAEYRLHLSRVINAPGSHLARTRDELSVELSDLENQNYESKNSSIIDEIILKECGVIDGSVAKNIANHLIKS